MAAHAVGEGMQDQPFETQDEGGTHLARRARNSSTLSLSKAVI